MLQDTRHSEVAALLQRRLTVQFADGLWYEGRAVSNSRSRGLCVCFDDGDKFYFKDITAETEGELWNLLT